MMPVLRNWVAGGSPLCELIGKVQEKNSLQYLTDWLNIEINPGSFPQGRPSVLSRSAESFYNGVMKQGPHRFVGLIFWRAEPILER